jgi:hypothetical protein
MSLYICACRQDIARTGRSIVANMAPVANAFILCRITGISAIMHHVTSSSIAIGMMDRINIVAMIAEMITAAAMMAETTMAVASMVITKVTGIVN